MDREVTVTYTPDLIKVAARKVWADAIGISGFTTFAVLVAIFAYVWVSGDRTWVFGFWAAVVFFGLVMGWWSYHAYLQQSMDKFNRMGSDPTVRFRFTDFGIWGESDLGSSEISWKFIGRILRLPKVWIIYWAKQGYSTLPIEEIDEELQQFIIHKVTENGGKII